MHKDKELRKQLRKDWDLTYYQKKRKLVDEAFGRVCYFGHSGNRVINIHRKDGQPHKKIKQMSLADIQDLIVNHKDEYVPVCSLCHTSVHWCMNHLGLTWEDMTAKL